MHVIHNGISHAGYTAEPVAPNPPVIGFFARLCKDKGLDTLIDAFIKLKASNSIPQLTPENWRRLSADGRALR